MWKVDWSYVKKMEGGYWESPSAKAKRSLCSTWWFLLRLSLSQQKSLFEVLVPETLLSLALPHPLIALKSAILASHFEFFFVFTFPSLRNPSQKASEWRWQLCWGLPKPAHSGATVNTVLSSTRCCWGECPSVESLDFLGNFPSVGTRFLFIIFLPWIFSWEPFFSGRYEGSDVWVELLWRWDSGIQGFGILTGEKVIKGAPFN